jgi:hypothetical protein
MRRVVLFFGFAVLSAPALAQSSLSACGPLPEPSDRQVMKVFDGLRVCLLALRPAAEDELPRDWAAKARTLILETQRDGDNRRAAISGSSVTWTINGRPAPLDSTAQAWQKAVVDLADAANQADWLRRQVADLRSQIDSLPQRIAATKAQIAFVEKRDRELNLEILNAGKRERELRSNLSALQRQRSSAQGQAARAAQAAASATDPQARAAAQAQAQAARDAVSNLDDAINGVEYQIGNSGSSRQIADAQEALRALAHENNIALLRLKLTNYESINPADIEQQIQSLDATAQQPVLDAEVDAALARLKALLR